MHWHASKSSLLFDWTSNAKQNASHVLQELLDLPAARVAALQSAVRTTAWRMHYRGDHGNATDKHGDAIDVLVSEGLLRYRYS